MKAGTIATIDPGNSGAIAILSGAGDLIEIFDMPTVAVTVGRSSATSCPPRYWRRR